MSAGFWPRGSRADRSEAFAATAGEHVVHAAYRCTIQAWQRRSAVVFQFNGDRVLALPLDHATELAERWSRHRAARQRREGLPGA